MGVILGLDVGSSTSKIVVMSRDRQILSAQQVTAGEQLTALFGAVGQVLYKSGRELQDVDALALTGVGGSFLKGDVLGIPTVRVSEMDAMGKGGLFLSGFENALICSMGTGTTYVVAGPDGVRHIGGIALGGGTLTGLSARLFGTKDYSVILQMAQKGDLTNVDKLMSEISLDQVSNLPDYATASNLGKMKKSASDEDVAIGLFNMICQAAGTMAVFAARIIDTKDVVVTGSLASADLSRLFLGQVGELYDIRFHIHEHCAFATAVGAAMHAF